MKIETKLSKKTSKMERARMEEEEQLAKEKLEKANEIK